MLVYDVEDMLHGARLGELLLLGLLLVLLLEGLLASWLLGEVRGADLCRTDLRMVAHGERVLLLRGLALHVAVLLLDHLGLRLERLGLGLLSGRWDLLLVLRRRELLIRDLGGWLVAMDVRASQLHLRDVDLALELCELGVNYLCLRLNVRGMSLRMNMSSVCPGHLLGGLCLRRLCLSFGDLSLGRFRLSFSLCLRCLMVHLMRLNLHLKMLFVLMLELLSILWLSGR